MRIADYWVRVRVEPDGTPTDDEYALRALGWSNQSEQDAMQVALQRARNCAHWLAGRKWEPAGHAYPYPDRPMREMVVERMEQGGKLIAAITRNSYGSLVLNTASTMFIDIDSPPSPSFSQRLRKWLRQETAPTHEENVLQEFDRITRENRDLSFRVYRTAMGMRAVVKSRPFDPTADETKQLMQRVQADPQYQLLCRTQACFRARLTPKHWRCGLPRPPLTFPYETDEAREAFDIWLSRYEQKTRAFAACEVIEDIGSSKVHDEVRTVLDWHDNHACRADAKLA